MGIKDFLKVKIDNTKSDYNGKMIIDLSSDTKLPKFKGQRICIDAMNMIYRAILAMRNVTALSDKEGKTTAHLNTIFNQIIMLQKAGIQQIWVFDSPECCPMKKEHALAEREKRRTKSKDEKVQFKVTGEHIRDIQELLSAMGVMYITAPAKIEAEQYGAMMTRGAEDERFCQYMMSNDADVLLFGGNLLKPLRVKSASGKSSKTAYVTLDVEEVLRELNFKQEQLIEVGLALGCDFAPKTPRVGPKTVVKKVRESKITWTPAQLSAKAYFMQDVKAKGKEAKIVKSTYDRQKVIDQLLAREFKEDRVTKRLEDYEAARKSSGF